MAATSEIVQDAVMLLNKGRGNEALQLCKGVLEREPENFAALYTAGTIFLQRGDFATAEAFLKHAVNISPDKPEAHNNLGLAFAKQGKPADAIAQFEKALARRPHYPNALLNLGNTLRRTGRAAAAVAAYDRAVLLSPQDADLHYNRGGALEDLSHFPGAIAAYQLAIKLRPAFAQAYNNLGNVFSSTGKLQEASDAFTAAIHQKPDYAEAHANRASARFGLRQLAGALEDCDTAISLNPLLAEAYCNRCAVRREMGEISAATADGLKALEIKPDYRDAQWNLALIQLLTGNWKAGWAGFELRFSKAIGRIEKPAPEVSDWAGESLADKDLLIYCEQGLGDTIQFIRLALALRTIAKRIVVLAPPRLVPLIAGLGLETTSDIGGYRFDCKIALLSLPRLLGVTPQTLSDGFSPYVVAGSTRSERWAQKLPQHGIRVGICWQGNPDASVDSGRSMALDQFKPLAEIPGVHLVSLQKGPGVEQISSFQAGHDLLAFDKIDDDEAFADTIAIIENLDLVITSDTAVAHLCGAMGKPVWVALKFVPDWRWLLDRMDCPWYPSARLYRQTSLDDWSGLFARFAHDLSSASRP
jgi:tetratricopeptide (TPR) repeat protein